MLSEEVDGEGKMIVSCLVLSCVAVYNLSVRGLGGARETYGRGQC